MKNVGSGPGSDSGGGLDSNEFLKTIYLSDMKLMNDDGSLNFLPNEEGIPPTCSLGSERAMVGQGGKVVSPLRVEFAQGGQSPLQGPDSNINGFKPGDSGMKAADYDGAKMFTYPVSDLNTGLLSLTFSSEAMFNNWTDKRVRRRLFGSRVRVVQGTSPMTVDIGVRIYDGQKFIPPIAPIETLFVLEDVENGKATTKNYNLIGALGKKDRRAVLPFDPDNPARLRDLLKCFVYALFEDSRLSVADDFSQDGDVEYSSGSFTLGEKYTISHVGSTDFVTEQGALTNNIGAEFTAVTQGTGDGKAKTEVFLPRGIGNVIKSRLIFKSVASDIDFVEKFYAIKDSVTVSLYGQVDKDFEHYLKKYMDEAMRVSDDGSALEKDHSLSPSISKSAEVLANLYSQINLIAGRKGILFGNFFNNITHRRSILHNNLTIIMDLLKRNSIDESSTLGDDGYIYDLRTQGFKYTGTSNNAIDIIHEDAWKRLPDKQPMMGTGLLLMVPKPNAIWQGTYKSIGLVSRNQGRIHISGISTSPASMDFNIQLPYVATGQTVNVQLMRLTREITTAKEMQEKSTRLSLKGITKFKTVRGEPVKFRYPGTAWMSMEFDSVNFQNIPERNYLVKLKKVAVPQNYNTRVKKYLGAWNGLFKGQQYDGREGTLGYSSIPEDALEWTDNPAWILLDILLNQRFGVGRSGMVLDNIDIWSLYAVAKFCDELVPSGFPLERPLRKFRTNNVSTKNETAESYLTPDQWNASSHSS